MNIGILGAGSIAKHMAKTLAQMEDANAYAIASRDITRAREFAKEMHIEKFYGNYEELLQDPLVELVYIASPHSHHYEHAMLALKYNKAVLCEKAFMANAKQAREVYAYAKQKNLFISEAIWTRYLPSLNILKDVVESGVIGEVSQLSANLGYTIDHVERLIKPEYAGGALLDVGVYPLHFMACIFGLDIASIQTTCIKNEYGVDMKNASIFTYKDGRVATIQSAANITMDQYGILYGDKGFIIAKNINNITCVEVYDQRRKNIARYEVPKQITGFEYQVRACIKAIRQKEIQCAEIPHEESIAIMELMDTLREEWELVYPFE